MPAKKMRVELFDSEGNKYTVSFEGQITREKALRLLDMVELLGGISAGEGNPGNAVPAVVDQPNKYSKVRMIIQKHFPLVWFSSRDVQLVYEQELKEPISLSTVATYLYRMASKGLLAKAGASNRLKYRLMPNYPQILPKQQAP
ncbi:MAG: hypothetical protein QMD20_02360 [Candidatus Bathyarchaeia archaeon]|nr:hypothetical protein [Candidatus Bathyarchaeia archaeon]